VFLAYTPTRPDYNSLGSFGNIECVVVTACDGRHVVVSRVWPLILVVPRIASRVRRSNQTHTDDGSPTTRIVVSSPIART
jgi:hypothetical protein